MIGKVMLTIRQSKMLIYVFMEDVM